MVSATDVFEDNDLKQIYIVMDYCKKGEILSDRFWNYKDKNRENKWMLEPEARIFFRQLLLGIDYRKKISKFSS